MLVADNNGRLTLLMNIDTADKISMKILETNDIGKIRAVNAYEQEFVATISK